MTPKRRKRQLRNTENVNEFCQTMMNFKRLLIIMLHLVSETVCIYFILLNNVQVFWLRFIFVILLILDYHLCPFLDHQWLSLRLDTQFSWKADCFQIKKKNQKGGHRWEDGVNLLVNLYSSSRLRISNSRERLEIISKSELSKGSNRH